MMGVRLALGARPAAVAAKVLRDGVVQTSLGAAVGALLSLALLRWLGARVALLSPLGEGSGLALTASLATLLAVALLASWLPARRASRVDPAMALRQE